MAISIALFGMALGAIIVYLAPKMFDPQLLHSHLAFSALLFGVTTVVSFWLYLHIPFSITTAAGMPWQSLVTLTAIYLIIAVPFVFSGICVTLALTKLPLSVGKLYAADLIGAASGCIGLIVILHFVSAPTAVLIIGICGMAGALFFLVYTKSSSLRAIAIIIGLILTTAVIANIVTSNNGNPWLRLLWGKYGKEGEQIYEKWNSFSRITVTGNPTELLTPYGWGMSTTYPTNKKIQQLWLTIDASATTPLTRFSGALKQLDFLRYDIVNLAHYLRHNADVLVIGAGGGRDILSALAFRQKAVVGVEVNDNILEAVNKKFGDFTGHLDHYPQIKFVNAEARSYLASSKQLFNVIQISLIDSWAATAAGAFVLTENSLYTVQAWKNFLERLKPGGILTCSRWYFKEQPGEIYRLTALAIQALRELGISNPRDHIIIVRHMETGVPANAPEGVGTILVSKQPFTPQDVAKLSQITTQLRFEIVLSPQVVIDNTFVELTSKNSQKFIDNFPINISAPTDNQPFFFQMLKFNSKVKWRFWQQSSMSTSVESVIVLYLLLLITLLLSLIFIITPLVIQSNNISGKKIFPLLLYFVGIGFGFMLVEVSQMQRLIILLGHPIYGLAVLLFSLLLASGCGSFTVRRINNNRLLRLSILRLSLLLIVLALFGLITPAVTNYFAATNIITRVLLTVLILLPIGFFMGMALPLGMEQAKISNPGLAPLLFGVNGATSVFASVLAVVLALNVGISSAFWSGVGCYGVSLISLLFAKKNR